MTQPAVPVNPLDMRQAAAVKDILRLALGGAALGGGIRGLSGLLATATGADTYADSYIPQPTTVFARRPQEREKSSGAVNDALTSASNYLAKKMPNEGLSGAFFGNGTTDIWRSPAVLALGLPLVAGATYGGWKATDAVLDAQRKKKLDAELSEAEQAFMQALTKRSSDATVADDDVVMQAFVRASNVEPNVEGLRRRLRQRLQKRTSRGTVKKAGFSFADIFGPAAGLYTLLLGGTALGSGLGTYSFMKKRQSDKILREALEARARERWQQRPTGLRAELSYLE